MAQTPHPSCDHSRCQWERVFLRKCPTVLQTHDSQALCKVLSNDKTPARKEFQPKFLARWTSSAISRLDLLGLGLSKGKPRTVPGLFARNDRLCTVPSSKARHDLFTGEVLPTRHAIGPLPAPKALWSLEQANCKLRMEDVPLCRQLEPSPKRFLTTLWLW